MTDGQDLGEEQIRACLHGVADALPSVGPQHVMVMVGGALLAWRGLRASLAWRERDEEDLVALWPHVALRRTRP